MSPKSAAARIVALSSAAVLSVLLLSGCSTIQGLIAGGDDVFSIAVGDCWDDQDLEATEVSTVASVECAEPHDNEAYASIILDDASFPGDASLLDTADQRCYEEFETFVGLNYDESVLYFSYLYPTSDSWDNGDKEILCFLYDETKTTGSLAGVAR